MDDLDPDLDLSENSIHKYYEEVSTASDSMTILDDYAILGFPFTFYQPVYCIQSFS